MLFPFSDADSQRLEVLTRYGGLDGPPDRALDRITVLASRLFDVPVSLVSLVGEDRQTFRSCYGLGITGTSRDVSFCTYAVEQDELLVVEDATRDPRFCDNPLVTGPPYICFYAGAPLRSRDGVPFGSLCLIDRSPRTLSAAEAQTLTDLAEMVVDELELRHEMETRKAVEAEMEVLGARFQKMLLHSSDVITILDAEGRIEYESPSIESLLGYHPDDLVGQSALDYVHQDDVAMVADMMRLSITTDVRQPPITFRWRHRDGSWVHLEAVGTNLFHDPSIGGLLVNSRDVSLNLRYAQEREARHRAEEMLRLQDELLTNFSHELRTPLAGILGVSSILSEEVGPEQKSLVDVLADSGNRLQRTLTAMIELAQLEGGTLQLLPSACDLDRIAEAAAARILPAAQEKGLTLRFVSDGPITAQVDPHVVGRGLDYLLDNAVKFTDRGEVTVCVRHEQESAVIEVADTGIGMEETFLTTAFEPFQQESQGLSRTYEGVGVGLTLANRLVTRTGGTLTAASNRGVGSTFTMRFPAITP